MEANTMNPDQPALDGSSLIWVHIVCNICYLRALGEETADDKSHDWQEKS